VIDYRPTARVVRKSGRVPPGGGTERYRLRATKERVVPRDKIILECTECKSRNFFTDKNKRKHPERVERRKYCPRCDTHRIHKESK
jgi:large subunit ribosomal protein L33